MHFIEFIVISSRYLGGMFESAESRNVALSEASQLWMVLGNQKMALRCQTLMHFAGGATMAVVH